MQILGSDGQFCSGQKRSSLFVRDEERINVEVTPGEQSRRPINKFIKLFFPAI
jgi:hypothetical protein